MIKIFRSLRKKTLMKGKNWTYLKYAIGEIILVMIGILLALQVNNWNENRKEKSQLSSILKTVKEDFATDTTLATNIIRFYDTINKYSIKYTQKKINSKNIDSFVICRSLVTIYQPMTIQKKGYKLLQNYSNSSFAKKDSLITDLGQFYSYFDAAISTNNDLVKDEVLRNLNHLKSKDWFAEWSQGVMTDAMRTYFGESIDYRNRVIANDILATRNHQAVLKQYKNAVTKLLEDINVRLEEE